MVNGLVIAIVLGTAVGLAMGRIKLFDRLADVYVSGLYAMPMVAVLPPFALWFGYSGDARLATVVFAAFFSIAINAADGALGDHCHHSTPRQPTKAQYVQLIEESWG